MALPLPSADVAVLFDNGAHPLPETVTVGQAMHRPQHVVPQIGEEKEGVIISIFKRELLLIGKTLKNLVNESGDLGGQSPVGLEAMLPIQNRQQEDY
jgi:hypothetical protein